MLSTIFIAKLVLPTAGRAASIIRSLLCKPFKMLSIPLNLVLIPIMSALFLESSSSLFITDGNTPPILTISLVSSVLDISYIIFSAFARDKFLSVLFLASSIISAEPFISLRNRLSLCIISR